MEAPGVEESKRGSPCADPRRAASILGWSRELAAQGNTAAVPYNGRQMRLCDWSRWI